MIAIWSRAEGERWWLVSGTAFLAGPFFESLTLLWDKYDSICVAACLPIKSDVIPKRPGIFISAWLKSILKTFLPSPSVDLRPTFHLHRPFESRVFMTFPIQQKHNDFSIAVAFLVTQKARLNPKCFIVL